MRKFTSFFLLLFMMAIGMSAQTAPPSSGLGIDSSVSDVKVVYSGTATSLFSNGTPAACTETTAKIEKETLKDGNEVLKISNFGLVNIQSAEFHVREIKDVAESKDYLMFHIDIYSETATKLAVGALMWDYGKMPNKTKVVEIKGKEWTQIDIPVSYFVGDGANKFYALRIYDVDENGNATETNSNDKTFWIDNVYFYNYVPEFKGISAIVGKDNIVDEGLQEHIFVNTVDQKRQPIAVEGWSFSYKIADGDASGATITDDGIYTGGNAGTTTNVIVTAKKNGEEDITTTIKVTNVRCFRAPNPTDVAMDAGTEKLFSVYSDYFTTNSGWTKDNGNFIINGINGGLNSSATVTEEKVGTNNVLRISDFKELHIKVNESENIAKNYFAFHIDIFSQAKYKLAIAPMVWDPALMPKKYAIVETEAGQWKQIDLPMEYFIGEGHGEGSRFYALRIKEVDDNGNIITDGKGEKTFWIDNVYLYNYAQELHHLDPAFQEMEVKAVKTNETLEIKPTAIDTKDVMMRNNSFSEAVTYEYEIDGDDNGAKIENGIYTGGTAKTSTKVKVTATQGNKSVSEYVTIANVDDSPVVDLKAVGRDDKVVTLQLNIASLQKFAKKIVLKQDDKEIATISDVPTNVDLRYRVDGLTADTEYKYTLEATVQGTGDKENQEFEGTGTVTAKTLVDFNPGQVDKSLRPSEAANKVINLFCSRSIYKKSPLYGMAASDDNDPARNIKTGDQFFTMYTKTPMEIGKLHYTKVEDVPAVVPASVSPRVYSRSCTPKFKDVKWVEEDAPKRSFAKNYALVEASKDENATEEQKNGDYCLRITQFEYNEILFGGADGNIQKSFDCRPTAFGPKLKALKMNMCANRDMTVKVSMKNLVNRDPIWKTVTLEKGKWQTVEFNSKDDGFTTSMSNCGLILQREAVAGDGYTPDNVTGMLFVDNLYYVLEDDDDVSNKTFDSTLRKVTKDDPEYKDKYIAPKGWHWGDAANNEEEDILYDDNDPKIKMAVIAGVFDKYEWEGKIDKAKYESTKAYETLQNTIKRKDISWFDCRNVVGLDYQSTAVANLDGNGNAFMLVEPTGGNHSERGVSFPLFSPNNIYMIDNNGQEEYYGNYILQYLRQDQYAPTNKNIVRVNANGVKYYQNYVQDRYNTLILPFEGRMESIVKAEDGSDIPAIRGVYKIEEATQDTNDDGGKHTIVYFKKLKKEEDNTFKLAANVPYLVVADNRGTEENENYGNVISIEAIDEHTGLNFDENNAVTVELGTNNSFTFGGLYHDKTVSSADADNAEYKYGDIYVFAAAQNGENYNTLRVGRLKEGGTMHQYRCFFDFANATKEYRAKLQFCFDESDGETTNIRLATDEEVRAIVGGIYSIDGKRISNNADDANKLGLPKGMYIINGKKVIIK